MERFLQSDQAFNKLKTNAFTLSASISAKASFGQVQNAIKLYSQRCVKWDPHILGAVIKICARMAVLEWGKLIHVQAIDQGFESNLLVGNALIDMYGKCGSLNDAHRLLENSQNRSVVTWGALIAGCAQHGHDQEAVVLLNRMQQEGLEPNEYIFASILRACCGISLDQCKKIHVQIIETGFELDGFIGSGLIDMYSRYGNLEDALGLFERLPKQDVVIRTVMISAYARHGCDQEAIHLFQQMKQDGVKPNQVTLLSILKGCSDVSSLKHGKLIHAHILEGDFGINLLLGSTLLDMYSKCGSLEDAWQVFNMLTKRDVVTWNAMIGGCIENGYSEEALQIFQQMRYEGLEPNQVTFVCILKACSRLATLAHGKFVHAYILENRFESGVFIGNSLIDMYSKCGKLEEAWKVFNGLPRRDVVTWGAVISGYVQHGQSEQSLQLFEQMQEQGIKPDQVIFVSILKACSNIGAPDQGMLIYAHVIECGSESSIPIGNTLINMYIKCWKYEDAGQVFKQMTTRDVVTWTAMLEGYAQHGFAQEAIQAFIQMQQEGIMPNQLTFVSILKASLVTATLNQCKLMHVHVIESSCPLDVYIATSLINAYANCGSLKDACRMFDNLPKEDVVTWNTIIAVCAQHGDYKLVLQYFEDMKQKNLKPDHKTFVSILCACSQMGLVEDGCQFLKSMQEQYGVLPILDHYNCVLDLFGRSGLLDDAEGFLQTMPFLPDIVAWTSLLGHCKTHGNVELGRRCFDQVMKTDCRNAAAYMHMSNIYSHANMQEDVECIEELRICANAWKKPGSALVDINNNVHHFIVGGDNQPDTEENYEKLKRICVAMKEEGYMPCQDCVLESTVDEEAEGDVLCGHCEALNSPSALPFT